MVMLLRFYGGRGGITVVVISPGISQVTISYMGVCADDISILILDMRLVHGILVSMAIIGN